MEISWRFARISDAEMYFQWANDESVRENSFNTNSIPYESHLVWFNSRLSDKNCFLYFFTTGDEIPVGQVRIEKKMNETVIGVSVDKNFRGKSLSSVLLNIAVANHFREFSQDCVNAYIKKSNVASIRAFEKANFVFEKNLFVNNVESILMIRKYENQ